MDRFLVAFLLILVYSIDFSYQQDNNVCPIGTDYYNGACRPSMCPNTHYLVNGACLLRPYERQSCGYGFDLINGICVQQNCPTNFVMINGLCQERFDHFQALPPPPPAPPLYCPNGYSIFREMCLPNPGIVSDPFCRPKPCRNFNCPFTCTEQTTPSTAEPTTSTTTSRTTTSTSRGTTTTNAPDVCPPEYVVFEGECRLISCIKGTFYKGRCLEPVCADGLVWTGHRCTQPEVITTILQIENNIITELNETGPDFHVSKSVNNLVYLNESRESNTEVNRNCSNKHPKLSEPPSDSTKCCVILTPRMCKKYGGSKWVCFNRQYRQCGEVCENYSTKYLRVHKIVENSGVLVLPPNPELQDCYGSDCKMSSVVDCSGCLSQQKQTCSPYCYRYRCLTNRCTFMDQSEYCTKYRGSPGCSKFDGCFESYCYDELAISQDDC